MKQLWAPWRIEFIKGAKARECIFCSKPEQDRDPENLILHRGRHAFVMMNRYPYSNGHLLVSPYRHASGLELLEDKVLLDLMQLLKRSLRILKEDLRPEGMNIGINNGKVAGAGFEEHIHFHIVPRWGGDTNFMTTLAEVRVIPEHLKATYQRLRARFRKAGAKTFGKKRAKT